MKKFFIISLFLLIAFSLFSCGKKKTNEELLENNQTIDNSNCYTVSFFYEGNLYATRYVNKDDSLIDIPEVPVKDGYDVSWSVTDFTSINENTSVNAIFSPKTYTIRYYLDDELYQTKEYEYGASIDNVTPVLASGYVFSGWNNLPSTMISSNLEVYGKSILISNNYDISEYASGSVITISEEGAYSISGTNTNVSFNIASNGNVSLCLNGVNDSSLTTPFITNNNSELSIIVMEDTYLADNSSNEVGAVIYSLAPLSIGGNALLSITSNDAGILTSKSSLSIISGDYKIISNGTAIQAKGKGASLSVTGGRINITSVGAGLKSKAALTIVSVDLDITSGEDAINCDDLVTINSGTITIASICDGIQGDLGVTINGGNANIKTNGGKNGLLSNYIYEVEDTTSLVTEDEYYGLYVLVGNKYIEIEESNYTSYSNYTTFYNRVSCKGIKSDSTIDINGGTIIIDSLDDGINSDTTITINNGTVTIDTASDGIQGDTSVIINDGIVLINGNETSGKGIKSQTLVSISGGNINVNTNDDAIHSNEYVELIGGLLTLSSSDDGVHADTSLMVGELEENNDLLTVNVLKSYEGLEAGTIYINSGMINIVSSDDGINAAGGSDSSSNNDSFKPFGGGFRRQSVEIVSYAIYIKGSNLIINSSGDGIDSNGSIYISGGKTIVYGPTNNGNGALDKGDAVSDVLSVTGGTIIAIGSSGMVVSPTSGNSITKNVTISKDDKIVIKDAVANVIFEITALKNAGNIVFSSDDLVMGNIYSIYINGNLKENVTCVSSSNSSGFNR